MLQVALLQMLSSPCIKSVFLKDLPTPKVGDGGMSSRTARTIEKPGSNWVWGQVELAHTFSSSTQEAEKGRSL